MDIRGKGVSFSRVSEIIAHTSNDRYSGHVVIHESAKPLGANDYGFRGRVRTDSSSVPGSRVSWSGRRLPAACWHAYRDVIRAVLTEYPHAVVRTAMARYDGLEGFERDYPDTAYKNIGSMVSPVYMTELCEC